MSAPAVRSDCDTAYSKIIPEVVTARLRIVPVTSAENAELQTKELSIFDKATGARLGWVGVALEGSSARVVNVSIIKSRRGEELGPEAEAAVIDQLFRLYPVEKIEATIAPSNARSASAHKKLGFQEVPGSKGTFIVTPDGFRRATAGRSFGKKVEADLRPLVPTGN